MNLTEIHEFINTVIRGGAAGIASFIMGAAIAAFIAWKFGNLLRDKRLQQKANELEVMYIVECEKKRSAEKRARSGSTDGPHTPLEQHMAGSNTRT